MRTQKITTKGGFSIIRSYFRGPAFEGAAFFVRLAHGVTVSEVLP